MLVNAAAEHWLGFPLLDAPPSPTLHAFEASWTRPGTSASTQTSSSMTSFGRSPRGHDGNSPPDPGGADRRGGSRGSGRRDHDRPSHRKPSVAVVSGFPESVLRAPVSISLWASARCRRQANRSVGPGDHRVRVGEPADEFGGEDPAQGGVVRRIVDLLNDVQDHIATSCCVVCWCVGRSRPFGPGVAPGGPGRVRARHPGVVARTKPGSDLEEHP